MLIEFRVANYRSIGDEQIISLIPSPKQKDFESNIIVQDNYSILNCLAFYGPNSSGKSNVLRAFELFDRFLYLSTQTNSTAKLPYDPFLLREGYDEKPCMMEMTFLIEGTRYRYGFEFKKDKVTEEWLYRKKTGREVELFLREGDTIEVFSSLKASQKIIDAAIEATRDNALFLSFCDLFNIDEAKSIFKWFDKFIYVNGLDTSREALQTIRLLENEKYKTQIKEYLDILNLGINDLQIDKKEFDPSELPENLSDATKNSLLRELGGKTGVKVNTVHSFYGLSGELTDKKIAWPLEQRESEGTKKAFHFSGPVLYTLINGGVLIVDEIEAKMHPLITLNTIKLFLDKKTNPKNAQIIFATHDTNILHYAKLRRDQINFVEKNHWESTEIFALSDFKYKNDNLKERHDIDKEKRYLEGRYGAIPELKKAFSFTI
ncbi:MAG TPA: ATP-binding protein [Saprospiraceae bacterium]|nr:ATP-binding protein [Saprospiraceae bacterium]